MSERDAWPDGIEDPHLRSDEAIGRHANPFALVLLGLVLLAALLGFAGREVDRSASGNGVTLTWHGPELIRSGEFLEMRISVEGTRAIEALVLGVEASLWEDLTINTLIPGAAEERGLDGEFLFDFGPLEPGSRLSLKVDAQINPDRLGGTAGSVTVYDGDQLLVELPLEIGILP